MTATRIALLASLVSISAGSGLLEARALAEDRGPACDLIQSTYQGSCPEGEEAVTELCRNRGGDCPAEPTEADCEDLEGGIYLVTCRFAT